MGLPQESTPLWYVVHTYSGYENKVKTNREKTVENRDLQDMIVEVRIPVEDAVEIKNGKGSVFVDHKGPRIFFFRYGDRSGVKIHVSVTEGNRLQNVGVTVEQHLVMP